VPFPRTVAHLLEYLQARADEPCGLSALQGVAAGYSFMESCCGYPAGQRLVDQPLYEAFLKELMAGFQGPCAAAPRQAPRFPLALILALEREVVDEDVATCYRLFAWWHLLAVWASLRFDDHRGLAPSAVHLTPRGLEAVLSRTKTTGPGKRVTALPLIVGYGAYLRQPQWLAVGWRLWQAAAPYVRDYLLVKPSADLQSTHPVELSYEQASRMSRAVLAGLPREDDVLPALAEPVVGLFTQHSARCWLPSMAALAEVSEADLSYLGRWSPTVSKGYVRTATEVVTRVQETVSARVRQELAGVSGDIIGEQSAYLDLRRELLRRGHAEPMINDQFDAMFAWTLQLADSFVESVPGPSGRVTEQLEPVAAEEPPCVKDVRPDEVAGVGDEAPPTPPLREEASAAGLPPLPVEATPGPPASGYVVSLSRSDWRKLHRIGGCTRHPGVHYLRFELLGDARPAPEDYDDYCRQCWRTGSPEEDTDMEESETEAEADEEPLFVEAPLGGEKLEDFIQD